MKRHSALIALLAATLFSTAAHCEVPKFELTPFAAYRFGGSFEIEGSNASYRLDDSAAFGVLLNMRHSANTQWEVLYSRQNTSARLREGSGTLPSVDADIHVLQFGGTYRADGETVRPYVAMTLGGTHIKTVANGSQSDTFLSGSIGLGINVQPSSQLGLRLEVRAHGALTDSSTDLFCQTGLNTNLCAIRIDGQIVTQIEAIAGVTLRF